MFATLSHILALLGGAVLIFSSETLAGQPVLSTTLGDVIGLDNENVDQTIETYYGIPFAKPPIGNLRFRAPQAAESWGAQPLNGTVKPRSCWQAIDKAFDRFEGVEMWNPDTELSEDCLYLNVWRRAPQIGDSPKTIMVWIYGGMFWSGSAVLDLYDGSDLAARKDVIVITIAYRLGPLGFMYLENNPEVSGNAGLLDQVKALEWIKANAENLGGSPDDITIFGQSTGALSVGFHLLSPLSKGLFKNAILQSGSPTAYWAVAKTNKMAERVAKLAANVSCPVSLGDQLLSCLEGVDPEVLTDQQWILVDKWFDVPLGPMVDGIFLPSHPECILKTGNITTTNVMIGVNLHEGNIPVLYGFMDDFPLAEEGLVDRDPFRDILLTIANQDDELLQNLLTVYSSEFADANKRRMRILDAAAGDSLIKCSVVEFARSYTLLGGRVFLYSFEEKFKSNPWPGWLGVPHGYEVEAVFGVPLGADSTNPQEDKDLTKTIMGLWTSFAKNGSPSFGDVEWPAYTTRYEEWVKIRSKDVRVVKRPRKHACDLWAHHLHYL
ncbi:hypothetical protein EGW08_010293 [Elysia chlorotica]|uniref:Carboxylesterase type B domain-containing protein n=1 Tax=Elysia chlorotica TaxID=188477 RepID=A0A433TK56_ELYCH|nr:hypothetical protein EGW08_010293 [Elysia chlorotica]